MNLIIVLIILIVFYFGYKWYMCKEHLMSPGYFNRADIDVSNLPTYGGSDSTFAKDVRFGI